jgi:hypothetical protein
MDDALTLARAKQNDAEGMNMTLSASYFHNINRMEIKKNINESVIMVGEHSNLHFPCSSLRPPVPHYTKSLYIEASNTSISICLTVSTHACPTSSSQYRHVETLLR